MSLKCDSCGALVTEGVRVLAQPDASSRGHVDRFECSSCVRVVLGELSGSALMLARHVTTDEIEQSDDGTIKPRPGGNVLSMLFAVIKRI